MLNNNDSILVVKKLGLTIRRLRPKITHKNPEERIKVINTSPTVYDAPPGEVKEDLRLRIEKSLSLLRSQLEKLDAKYKELIARSRLYFEKCIEALIANDEDRARIYASEIAELRKLANAIMHSHLILLQVRIRLESILELGEILVLVKPLLTMLESVKDEVSGIIPEASENLRSLAYVIEDFIATSEGGVNTPDAGSESSLLSDEALTVLQEAKRIAAEKVKEQFPDIPTLTEEERKVLTYLNNSLTEHYSIEELASKTGIEEQRLSDVLRNLHEKGLIELEIEHA